MTSIGGDIGYRYLQTAVIESVPEEMRLAQVELKAGNTHAALDLAFKAAVTLVPKDSVIATKSGTEVKTFLFCLKMLGDLYETRGLVREAEDVYYSGKKYSQRAHLPSLECQFRSALSQLLMNRGNFSAAEKYSKKILVLDGLNDQTILAEKEWRLLPVSGARDLFGQGVLTNSQSVLKEALAMCLKQGGDTLLIRDICHALIRLGVEHATYHALSVGLTATLQLTSKAVMPETIDLPEHWVMVAASVSAELGLIITRWEGIKKPITLVVPGSPDQFALAELESILQKSKETLARVVTDAEGKTRWWKDRKALDSQLKDYLERIENSWLGENRSLLAPCLPGGTGDAAKGGFPVILVLGKDVQALPWESLPILRNGPVTRMPSVAFVQAHLKERQQQKQCDKITKAFYIMDADQNLPSTKKQFEKQFSEQRQWDGVCSKLPTKEHFVKALTEYDLFIYCDHDSGVRYLPEYDMKQIKKMRSVAMLMGCSSLAMNPQGKYDPSGLAVTYMLKFCPAVVGTLWDVTANDIDRFLQSTLDRWIDQKDVKEQENTTTISLHHAISKARDACILKYLVGAATVSYGLPK